MRALFHTAAAVGAGLVLLAATGCSQSEGGDQPPPRQPDALAGVDACSILTPQDASAAGVSPSGSPQTDVSSEPGCYYDGDAMTVTTYKNLKDTVDSSSKKSNWAKFDRVDVNGRPGATAVSSGSTEAQICSTMFDAGKGMIRVSAHGKNAGDQSACDQSQKIAKQIEPRMPKKQ